MAYSHSNLNKNAISAFEEYGVKNGREPWVDIVSCSGPPHKPVFTAAAKLGDRVVCEESATTKHDARMKAAEKARSILNMEDSARGGVGDVRDHTEDEKFCPIPDKHPVSALMEYAQSRRLAAPDFSLVSQDGPPHMPIFVVEISVGDRSFGQVRARSMKEARKKAACMALNQLYREGKLNRIFPVVVDSHVQARSSPPTSTNSQLNSSGRNAVSVLYEYAQKNCQTVRFDPVGKSGPSHKPVFKVRAIVGGTEFDAVTAGNMKEAKVLAAQKVIESLRQQRHYVEPQAVSNGAERLYNRTGDPRKGRPPQTLKERIAAAALGKVDQLMVNAPLVGRKVIAAIVMTTAKDDQITVISVGSGNRCLSGDQLRDDGTVLHDSHAEVLARRGFKRYLYKLLQEQTCNLVAVGRTGKLMFLPGVEFHLYISTAPCGDGALFVHSDRSEYHMKDVAGSDHEPVFANSRTQGLLRAKQENGEGTIPIEPGCHSQTLDGIQQGQRLRVMSCSDKICSWNVLGLQGALLSTVYEPVYLKSVILGSLYHHGHLSRALCCRVAPVSRLLPHSFRINHPDLGLVAMQDTSRAVERSRPLCLNWCHGDARPEITDGTTGMTNKTLNMKMAPSQLCKQSLFDLYKSHVWRKQQSGVTYGIRKLSADDYNRAKHVLKKHMETQGYGTWIEMPREVARFC